MYQGGEFRNIYRGSSGTVPRGYFRKIYRGIQALFQGAQEHIKRQIRHCITGRVQEHKIKEVFMHCTKGEFRNI